MRSKRFEQWLDFAVEVGEHIENYTVPQYGDCPDDPVEQFTPEDIRQNLQRYVNRIGSNARGPAEALRDCLKIAHYACVLKSKLSPCGSDLSAGSGAPAAAIRGAAVKKP